MYEQLFYWLSFCFIFLFGFLLGGLVAARFKIYLKVSKREDYEAKIKQLEEMIETMNKPMEEPANYKPGELFPPGMAPEFGLPRKISK